VLPVGDIERHTDHADDLAFARTQRLYMRFEDSLLPFHLVSDGLACQRPTMCSNRSEVTVLRPEVFKERFADSFVRAQSQGLETGAMEDVNRSSLSVVHRTAGIFSIITLIRASPAWRSF